MTDAMFAAIWILSFWALLINLYLLDSAKNAKKNKSTG